MLEKYYDKIKYLFSVSTHSGRGLSLGINMRRDWKILCATFSFLILLILLLDIYIFYIGSSQADNNKTEIPLNDSLILDGPRLDKVLSDWRDRELQLNKLLEGKAKFIDPSL